MKLSNWNHQAYDIDHFVLSFFYVILFFVSLGTLFRLVRFRHFSSSWQWIFYPLFLTGCFVRATFFVLQPLIIEDIITLDNQLNFLLNSLPSLLFFSDYLIILFLWAEIYHNIHGSNHAKIVLLRPVFIAVTVSMYSCAFILYIIDFVHEKPTSNSSVAYDSNRTEFVLSLFVISFYFFTSLAFLFYGIRIYSKFQKFLASHSKIRRQIMRKIFSITLLVSGCFFLRVVIVTYGTIENLSELWWFDGCYFFFLEWFPLTMMMYILHGDQRRRTVSINEESPLLN